MIKRAIEILTQGMEPGKLGRSFVFDQPSGTRHRQVEEWDRGSGEAQ